MRAVFYTKHNRAKLPDAPDVVKVHSAMRPAHLKHTTLLVEKHSTRQVMSK